MALAANYPIAIAPGMGLNAYLAFHVVSASDGGITYATAFSAVFTAGVLFIILSLTPLRKQLIEAIPNNLKYGITTGIGLFIAFIGLRQAGIVAADESNLVTLGNLHSPGVILTLVGLLISVVLMVLNVSGALFIGMAATALIAFFTGQLHFPKGFMSLPHLPEGLMISNPFTAFGDVIHHGLYAVVFSLLLVTIFDTTGTMIGVAEQVVFRRCRSRRKNGAYGFDCRGDVCGFNVFQSACQRLVRYSRHHLACFDYRRQPDGGFSFQYELERDGRGISSVSRHSGHAFDIQHFYRNCAWLYFISDRKSGAGKMERDSSARHRFRHSVFHPAVYFIT